MFLDCTMEENNLKGTIELTSEVVDVLAFSLMARIEAANNKPNTVLLLSSIDQEVLTILLSDRILKSPNNIQNKEKK